MSIAELKRRNVVRMAGLYLVGAWLVVQVAGTVLIYSWLGDRNLALDQLAISPQNTAGITYGDLKLQPFWDPLRGDPRFEKIVASVEAKGNAVQQHR